MSSDARIESEQTTPRAVRCIDWLEELREIVASGLRRADECKEWAGHADVKMLIELPLTVAEFDRLRQIVGSSNDAEMSRAD